MVGFFVKTMQEGIRGEALYGASGREPGHDEQTDRGVLLWLVHGR
jgi:hypothetical protein